MVFREFLKYYYKKKIYNNDCVDKDSQYDYETLMKNWISSSHNNMKKNFIVLAECLNKDLKRYFPEGMYKKTKDGKKRYGKCVIPDEEVDSLCDVLYTYDSKISRLVRKAEENYNFIDLQRDLFNIYEVETEDELLKKAAENDYINNILVHINYFLHKEYYLFYKETIKQYNDKLSKLMVPNLSPNEAQFFAKFYSSMLKNLSTLLDKVLEIFVTLRNDELFQAAMSGKDVDINIEKMFNQAVRTYIKENDFMSLFKYSLSDDKELLEYTSKQDRGLYDKCKLSDIDLLKNIDINEMNL